MLVMPVGAVVCQLGVSALLELRARSYFLTEMGRPQSELGTFWQYLADALAGLKLKGD